MCVCVCVPSRLWRGLQAGAVRSEHTQMLDALLESLLKPDCYDRHVVTKLPPQSVVVDRMGKSSRHAHFPVPLCFTALGLTKSLHRPCGAMSLFCDCDYTSSMSACITGSMPMMCTAEGF